MHAKEDAHGGLWRSSSTICRVGEGRLSNHSAGARPGSEALITTSSNDQHDRSPLSNQQRGSDARRPSSASCCARRRSAATCFQQETRSVLEDSIVGHERHAESDCRGGDPPVGFVLALMERVPDSYAGSTKLDPAVRLQVWTNQKHVWQRWGVARSTAIGRGPVKRWPWKPPHVELRNSLRTTRGESWQRWMARWRS